MVFWLPDMSISLHLFFHVEDLKSSAVCGQSCNCRILGAKIHFSEGRAGCCADPFICVWSEGSGVSFFSGIREDISACCEWFKKKSLKLTLNFGLTGFKTNSLLCYVSLRGEKRPDLRKVQPKKREKWKDGGIITRNWHLCVCVVVGGSHCWKKSDFPLVQ